MPPAVCIFMDESASRTIRVRVVTRASRRGVEELPDGSLRVRLNSPPVGGRANKELIEAVAGHFGVSRSAVKLVGGLKSRDKLLEIEE
jgi:uncharacterized protein